MTLVRHPWPEHPRLQNVLPRAVILSQAAALHAAAAVKAPAKTTQDPAPHVEHP